MSSGSSSNASVIGRIPKPWRAAVVEIAMTDEDFLTRWSRRKREVAKAEAEPRDEAKPASAESKPQVAQTAEPEFDLANLPPIESINALTDVTAFLRAGVPSELTRAALRRVWTADPAIRDFVGLAENSGDFNDPTAMAGFGPIEPAEVARLMAQFVMTPAEEKKIARAPEHLADQDVGQTGAASESDSEVKDTGERTVAESGAETHAASQNEEHESKSDRSDSDRSS